jgi:predicted RNA-binding protein YlqC (UPF0109 family)
MSTIDQQFVEFVVKSLVSKPDEVQVERRIDEKGVLLELTVDPEDLGRVIGKRGATAQSLRTLLRALGTKNDARYNLKIVDNGTPDSRSGQRDDQRQGSDDDTDAIIRPVDSAEIVEQEKTEIVEVPEETSSDRISQTRKELEDLDDLDV